MSTLPVHAAVVHVGKSHPAGTAPIRSEVDGAWPLRQRHLTTREAYLAPLDLLIAVNHPFPHVRDLRVLDVRWIVRYTLDHQDRVVFSTRRAPEMAHLLGLPAPVEWQAGDQWPMKTMLLADTQVA